MSDTKAEDNGARAADRLISLFERQILDGKLKDGEPLPPEREIVQTHGVSRTVVREALLALANRGLIEARPRFRPIVRAPGYDAAIQAVGSVVARLLAVPNGIKNLYDMREMMEASLAREAALKADRHHIAALKSALEANEAAIETDREFFETDIAFHAVLFQIPGNPVLPAIHKAYTGWLSEHWTKMPRNPGRNRTNFAAHKAIYDAILMRDPDAAEAALRRHLDDAWRQFKEVYDTP
ncbi:MAG: FCD domain-containing protein [Silicimonas sp.]|nr:FCD domain-containing protein [Silicimonas sp.]